MNDLNNNVRPDDREGDVIVLGTISVETRGLAGEGEPYGAIVLPGISED